MTFIGQGAIRSLFFLFQLQCGNAAPKHGSASQSLVAGSTLLGDPLAGRRKLNYLVALQTWQRVTRAGVSCPKPQPCECHCDCPNTVATGETPTAAPPCPVYPSFAAPTQAPTEATTTQLMTTP